MAALLERTIIHYSKNKLSELGSYTRSQAKLLAIYGKPMGFWYAYGEDWKNVVNAGKGGRNKTNSTFRYAFTLPESTFITNVIDASPDSIFELSQSNHDEFMKKYSKDEYRTSKDMILELAFGSFIMEGESAVLNEIFDMDNDFSVFCDKLRDDNDPDIIKIIEKTKITFPNIIDQFSPSDRALAADHIVMYDWMKFWEDVSDTLGGIEFHTDLFDIDIWNDIYLPWTSKLDIRSGVIFHPDTFRNGIIMEQMRATVFGGKKRYTLRKKRNRRKTFKKL